MTLRPVAARWFELLTTREELATVLDALARSGAVELETFGEGAEALFAPSVGDELNAYDELAKQYRAYWPEPVSAAPGQVEAPEQVVARGLAALERWRADADPVIAELERLSAQMRELEHLHTLLDGCPEPLPDLGQLGRCGPALSARLYFLPPGAAIKSLPQLVLHKRITLPDGDYLLVVGGSPDIAALEDQLHALKAQAVPIPADLPASARDAARETEARIERLRAEIVEARNSLESLAERHRISHVTGQIELIAWLLSHAKDVSATSRLAWVTGWTTSPDREAFCVPLTEAGLRCLVDFTRTPADAHPPTLLRNPPWARSFEVLTNLLGSPGQDEADPSIIVAIFAPILFGFMFGDVGQGAVLLAAGLVLRKRLPVFGLLVPGGIMAMVFGVLYGDVFTREDIIPALWLHPLHAPMEILGVAIGIGVGVLITGLLLNAAQTHWRGAAHVWWLRDFGLLAAYIALLVAVVWRPALWFGLAGAAWFVAGEILLGRKAPLSATVRGLAQLAESGLQLLVNTVSFARVGAFALAHAGLSVAVVEVAQAAGGVGYWVVLLLGNLLIIVLEGLIVGIQTTRLLLFEFFVRFLKGEGRIFKPLRPPETKTPSLKGGEI